MTLRKTCKGSFVEETLFLIQSVVSEKKKRYVDLKWANLNTTMASLSTMMLDREIFSSKKIKSQL